MWRTLAQAERQGEAREEEGGNKEGETEEDVEGSGTRASDLMTPDV